MRTGKTFLIILIFFVLSSVSSAQDRRTLDTKIADLVSQFPAGSASYLEKLMNEMTDLGPEGWTVICSQILPPGSGDDIKQRFAVESFSRYLSRNKNETSRSEWEKICISFASSASDNNVKDFFIKQLQLVGSNETAEAMKKYLSDKINCAAAISAISAVGGETAEHILAESLKERNLPCAAAVMNALASMNSELAVNEYILWASDQNVNTRAAAYNALAHSGDPRAYPILLQAARSYSYRWEHTGATASLLNYARRVGEKGDIRTMDNICKLLISKCEDDLSIQNKTTALETYVQFHGIDAMPEILKAASHSNTQFRNAAISMSGSIQNDEVVSRWISFYPKAIAPAKPEIIILLGEKKDKRALNLVSGALNDPDINVRQAAAASIAGIKGKEAAPDLIAYLEKYDSNRDQEAAVSALKTIAGNEETELLRPVLKDGRSAAKKSAIELMAWKKDHSYFSDILPFSSSEDPLVRSSAIKALADLAGPADQQELIRLLDVTENGSHISDLQTALINAANQESDPEMRSSVILEEINNVTGKKKLIPVLAKTGGAKALSLVLNEFGNGDQEMREVCFRALTSWKDYSASAALFEICASGNKTYEGPAFEGYLRQVKAAGITDEQKLLLYRKIMPYAVSAERKNQILTETGNLKTYPALFFVAQYLDDASASAAAAKAAMYIALPSVSSKNGMEGDIVREILYKVLDKLSGQELEYNKEMVSKYIASMPAGEGFVKIFNGIDLTGWQGLVENPVARATMKAAELARKQAEADKKVPLNWSVKDGCIVFNGEGDNLCSVREYGDFELLVDWKISRGGDSGIYLRGSPQVQIWDIQRTDSGAEVGSGGLYNNQKNISNPLKVADNPAGEWNSFRILMTGEKVSVWLNGELVVDNVTMENYWDRAIPIFPKGPIELQAHGTDLAFRDIYIREIRDNEYNLTPGEKDEGFVSLFNGRNLDGWVGDKVAYYVEDGVILTRAELEHGGNIYTDKEYSDFILRFDFLLAPGSNNGLGIRAPLTGDAAYVGMELQIIDNTTTVFGKLQPYQLHGSVYGVIPAKPGYLRPVGEWNSQEVYAKGNRIRVTLNGTVILDGDIAEASKNGTIDHRDDHTGLKNKTGHIGFLYHNSLVKFRNIRIKDLTGIMK